ncbi:hypothetical protein [Acanthopleuribacter pedis]|uniref:Uncharacterized protein n=1 Tax=Acanthopleuribacter pedis TaxID=442870 RepID=A0A8J7QBV0_9BACT|nr:hypothetical protein [Acanthopleuribacter pedis]MBO1322756.1 hypothetical protein [Acanthopleuribacter pedis]
MNKSEFSRLMQEAEAQSRVRRRRRLETLGDDYRRLSVLPAWTPRLLAILGIAGDEAWLNHLVKEGFARKKAPRRFWNQRGKASADLSVYEVTDQWREWVLADVLHDESQNLSDLERLLNQLATRIHDLCQSEMVAVPQATRYWMQLAGDTELGYFRYNLFALMDNALEQGHDHRALAYVTTARRLLPYLNPRAKLVVDGGARHLEVVRRKKADLQKLQYYLVRDAQIDAFEQVLADPEAWALHYLGMGGMGKTMLMRYLVSKYIPEKGGVAARVDFDFLDPDYPTRSPGLLLEALAEELCLFDQKGAISSLLPTLNNEILGFHEELMLPNQERGEKPVNHKRFDGILRVFAEMIHQLPQPVVLILDTCEELSGTRGHGDRSRAVLDTFAIFEALRRKSSAFVLVLAGRRLLAQAGADWDAGKEAPAALPKRAYLQLYPLQPFERHEAERYLEQRGVLEHHRESVRTHCQTDVFVRFDFLAAKTAPDYFSPFDLALYSDWLDQEPDLDLTKAAKDEDRYVARRIVGRITDPLLKDLLPAVALLGRFDKPTLAAAMPHAGADQLDRAWLDLTGLEWISSQGAFLSVLDGLRARLKQWFAQQEPSKTQATKDRLETFFEACTRDKPLKVDPEYCVDFIRLAPIPVVETWWPVVRDAMVIAEHWERLASLFSRLFEKAEVYDEIVPSLLQIDYNIYATRFNLRKSFQKRLDGTADSNRYNFVYLACWFEDYYIIRDRTFDHVNLARFKSALNHAFQQELVYVGFVRDIPKKPELCVSLLNACESILDFGWNEPNDLVEQMTRFLIAVMHHEPTTSIGIYAAFLKARCVRHTRKKTALSKQIRSFLADHSPLSALPVRAYLSWRAPRDLKPLIEAHCLRLFSEGVLDYTDIEHMLRFQMDSLESRLCSYFYCRYANDADAALDKYDGPPFPLDHPPYLFQGYSLQVAVLERSAVDRPVESLQMVFDTLKKMVSRTESKADAPWLIEIIKAADNRLADLFLRYSYAWLGRKTYGPFFDLEFATASTEERSNAVHDVWQWYEPYDKASVETMYASFQKLVPVKANTQLGLHLALDMVEFNRIAPSYEMPLLDLPVQDFTKEIYLWKRRHPLERVAYLLLKIRAWALGVSRKPNFARFSKRLGSRTLALTLIQEAIRLGRRLPEQTVPLLEAALDHLSPNPSPDSGLHLLCHVNLWYCLSRTAEPTTTHHLLPSIDTLMDRMGNDEGVSDLRLLLKGVKQLVRTEEEADDDLPPVETGEDEPLLAGPESEAALPGEGLAVPAAPQMASDWGGEGPAAAKPLEPFVVQVQYRGELEATATEGLYFFDHENAVLEVQLDDDRAVGDSITEVAPWMEQRAQRPGVPVLRIRSQQAALPAWELMAVDDRRPKTKQGNRLDLTCLYRLVMFEEPFIPAPPLNGVFAHGGFDNFMSGVLSKMWGLFGRGADDNLVHVVGRPMRLGYDEYRLSLGGEGHRQSGELMSPEEILAERKALALVIVQAPVDEFGALHTLECAHGRAFATALLSRRGVAAVLFLPPLPPDIVAHLVDLGRVLFEHRDGNWPNALLHEVKQLRQHIIASNPQREALNRELAAQICLMTQFFIDVQPEEE